MGARVTLSFYGDTQLDRTLARVSEAVQDARPAWEAMTDRFVALNARQFSSQGGSGSGGWAPLSPTYAAWKARHYPGKPILERTGALKDSLTRRPLPIEDLDAQRMVVGSDVDYGAYHQNGDGVPQRRPVELTEHARRDLMQILQRYIVTGETR